MLNIEWMNPRVITTWGLPLLGVCGLLFWYSWRVLRNTHQLWEDQLVLGAFSPRTRWQLACLCGQWLGIVICLVLVLAGPNFVDGVKTVPAGGAKVIFAFDGSNSFAAEDTRPFYGQLVGEKDPGLKYQWGTRLDTARYYAAVDLLPQLIGSEAGLIIGKSIAENVWNLTQDLSEAGAFVYQLKHAIQPGAARGEECDYGVIFQAALDEFARSDKEDSRKNIDDSQVAHFIVFFTDGFHTNQPQLDTVVAKLIQRKVNLLMVEVAGDVPTTVAKYDPETHRLTGEHFPGTTKLTTLDHIKGLMKDSADIIVAKPGTPHIHFSFPEKMGGHYATAAHSNASPVLLLIAAGLFINISLGGGGLPKRRYFALSVPKISINPRVPRSPRVQSMLRAYGKSLTRLLQYHCWWRRRVEP
jgi:hypothetical protein